MRSPRASSSRVCTPAGCCTTAPSAGRRPHALLVRHREPGRPPQAGEVRGHRRLREARAGADAAGGGHWHPAGPHRPRGLLAGRRHVTLHGAQHARDAGRDRRHERIYAAAGQDRAYRRGTGNARVPGARRRGELPAPASEARRAGSLHATAGGSTSSSSSRRSTCAATGAPRFPPPHRRLTAAGAPPSCFHPPSPPSRRTWLCAWMGRRMRGIA